MSEPTTADTLAAKMTGENPAAEEVVDPTAEIEATEPESEETTEATSEDELPENIKEILAKNRAEVKAAKAELTALKKQIEKPEPEAETETPEANPEPAVDDRYKVLYVNTAAKAALVEAGLATGTDRFLKMLDLSSVEVDDAGAISGLDEQVKSLTEEFSDLIAPAKPVRKIAKTDAAGRKETPVAPKSSAELLAERLSR